MFFQSLQQHLFRKPEGNEAFMGFQAGSLQGLAGGSNFASSPGSMPPPQQSRKIFDVGLQHGPIPQDGPGQSSRGQGVEQQAVNPVHQAYMHYALQAAHQRSAFVLQAQQQAKMGMLAPNQASAQASSSRNSSEPVSRVEKQTDSSTDQRHELKPPAQPSNAMRPMQAPQGQQSIQIGNNQITVAQLQALQAWAIERNIDLSNPANANLVPQLISLMQSQMPLTNQPVTSSSSSVPVPSQPVTSSPAQSPSGHSGSGKSRQNISPSPLGGSFNSGNANNVAMQQFPVLSRENLNQLAPRQSAAVVNGPPPVATLQSAANMNQGLDPKTPSENLQMQQLRQFNRSSSQSSGPSGDGGSGNNLTSQAPQTQQQRTGFTKQQLHVLKAQILAFRRLKKGEGTLPQELLRAITAPPLESQLQQQIASPSGNNLDKSAGKTSEEQIAHSEPRHQDSKPIPLTNGQNNTKEEAFSGDEKATASKTHMQGMSSTMEAIVPVLTRKEDNKNGALPEKLDLEAEPGLQKTPARSEFAVDRAKAVVPSNVALPETSQTRNVVQQVSTPTPAQPKDAGSTRKYHGPLFDFPFFTRKHDSFGSATTTNSSNSLALAYDIKDILSEEGVDVIDKKRSENLKKISGLLAVNLERKRIRPDLVLRLQIEEKKLRLADLQARLRDEVDQQQQEIMAMPDRPYRKFVRLCERQRTELSRQVQASQRALREKQLKSILQWRKKLLEAHWALRDSRTARNRGVAKYHERMLREFSKRKDDGRNKRMEALKNNDVERYREMLLEQQISTPGGANERYNVLSSFLTQTEEYLHKLGGKITAAKNQQEIHEAANAAAAAARLQGLSEEEVRAAAACAGEEVTIRNQFLEMNAPKASSSVSKYYNLAHAVNERVMRQPSMLRAGTLRDYQLVGLQWMLSLYNNKLNGILADEMGLGKTVQVMALIAYLMEFKGNYGPHLIIVPNAVLVNWKSELHTWLPSVSCIYYVGTKDQRSKLFSQVVCAMKFNVLVTTYEFIMYDRSKLSKIDWKYIVIDEAQRMKDRESVLARDLDRYRCHRRLLLTGTPLQNDLKELWSLLNLLLPEVFDNKKAFHDWFAQPFQKETAIHNKEEDDWLETEKKVIVIHRLHQILEPFMLRRRVEDVEGSLPPKVSIVLRCRMSAIQSAVYDWIKSTGTLRVDPEDEKRKVQKNPSYQPKSYKTLNNRCMELRKVCNHPLLNYPYFNDFSKDFLVRSCGKLWVLDRILLKLHKAGHRVLLFSTMTKLLDILEEYLQWRRLVYRRIDGTTSLEDRESAIVDFNGPETDCFIFLLSIRAAGRGLNLQSADTVIIYDPDPNPKNEEQAVARAHRIGQTREVKVIYMEAVVDKIPSHQKEDELRSSGTVDSEDDLVGKDRYIGSIESLIRKNIQQYKIDMADEVINAGRFDQRTTHEERRLTLETLLHDDERYQETVHDVPSLQEVNRMIARSQEEVEMFDQLDEDLDWIEEMTSFDQVPKWLRAGSRDVNGVVAMLSKKPSKHNTLYAQGSISEVGTTERRRGRPKAKKNINYKEIEEDDYEYNTEASDDERNIYSVPEEEGEIAEFEDDETSGGAVRNNPPHDKEAQSYEDEGGYEYPGATETRHVIPEQAGSPGYSSENERLARVVSPVSSQKFGSLSALEARPGSHSRRLLDELEEGEIALSGDSHVDRQQSGSGPHDRDEGEEDQVVQPKFKRKRSIRLRPRPTIEKRLEEKRSVGASSLQRGLTTFQADQKHRQNLKLEPQAKVAFDELNALKHNQIEPSSKNKRNMTSRRNMSKPQSKNISAPADDAAEYPSDSKSMASKMSDVIQRRVS
ncbi:hypothetical protein ACFE04_018669 [Oxalis oulophora]